MTKREKEAAMRRWIGQVYHNRGYELVPEVWAEFKAFYENIGWWDDITPGVRLDGQDKWKLLEKRLAEGTEEIIV
jgi:hypothetical protein